MSQYRTGTIAATNGSATVTAVDPDAGEGILADTQWLAEVTPGDLFYVQDDPVAYEIQTINSNTQLTLTSAYQGGTITPAGDPLTGSTYAIHRKFSTYYSFPLPSQGDIGLPVFIEWATVMMDAELKALDDRIVALEP